MHLYRYTPVQKYAGTYDFQSLDYGCLILKAQSQLNHCFFWQIYELHRTNTLYAQNSFTISYNKRKSHGEDMVSPYLLIFWPFYYLVAKMQSS